MNTKIRVSIVGAGRIADIHMHGYSLLQDKVDVCAVVDFQRNQAQFKAPLWGIPKSFGSLNELFAHETVDAVDEWTK